MNILFAILVTASLDPSISQVTTEEMAIFASNRLMVLESRYPDQYKPKQVIEILLEDKE